jgi:1,4-alpha-glucan branching enzyme
MHARDFTGDGFQWIDANDSDDSVITFLRLAPDAPPVMVACNFTPIVREGYRVGVPQGGAWRECLNSDAPFYGGSGVGNLGRVEARTAPCHGRPYSLSITLPPLAVVIFEPDIG